MQRVGKIDASLMAGAQNGHHETLFEQTLFEVMHFNIGQLGLEQALIAFNVLLMGAQTGNSLVHDKHTRQKFLNMELLNKSVLNIFDKADLNRNNREKAHATFRYLVDIVVKFWKFIFKVVI